MADQGTCDGYALLLASRELVGVLVVLQLEAYLTQSLLDTSGTLGRGLDAVGAEHDVEVALHGHIGQELEVLVDDAEALTQLGELSALDPSELVVEYACRALSYGYLGSDGLQERALTRAYWAYEVYELARAEL